ncbi:MAG TPA: helix-turn-helix domain-containing protein [Pseudonocardiaceae bacterium]|nr:helix-turn-helix domain-containing protein [Pseudonocardiaceae bacterium]
MSVEDLVEIWFGRPASVGAGVGVVCAYEALSMSPGPSVECRDWAIFRRFAPALAWDDDDIDNPFAVASVDGPALEDEGWVDPIMVERLRLGVSHLGPWTIPQRQWLVADLTDRGRSAAEIVKLLGVSVRTVERDRAVIQSGHLRQGCPALGSAVMAS